MSISYRKAEYQGSQLARVYDKTQSGWDGLITQMFLGYESKDHRPFCRIDVESLVIDALKYLLEHPHAVIEILILGELEPGVDPEKIIKETKLKAPPIFSKNIPKKKGK